MSKYLVTVSILFLCFNFSSVANARDRMACANLDNEALIPILNAYYDSGGNFYFDRASQDIASIAPKVREATTCDFRSLSRLGDERFILSHQHSVSFVGSRPSQPVYTRFLVSIEKNVCAKVPTLNFYAIDAVSNSNQIAWNPVLRNFFLYQGASWRLYTDRLYNIRKSKCRDGETLIPREVRVNIYTTKSLAEKMTSQGFVLPKKVGAFLRLYSGDYFVEKIDPKTNSWGLFRDDSPSLRMAYEIGR